MFKQTNQLKDWSRPAICNLKSTNRDQKKTRFFLNFFFEIFFSILYFLKQILYKWSVAGQLTSTIKGKLVCFLPFSSPQNSRKKEALNLWFDVS